VRAEDDTAEEPADLMASLRPEDAAVAVDGVTVTWGELRKVLGGPGAAGPASEAQAEKARALVEKFVQRCLLLAEARRRGLSVTEEEKKAELASLEQTLKAGGRTLEDYLKQFPEKPSSPLELSLGDTLLVVKLGKELVKDLAVTETELAQAAAQAAALREAMLQANERTRQQMKALAAVPEAATDAGFAELARQHSQGREASSGGVVPPLSRPQVTAANGGQPFSLNVGETSTLIETETSFRIIRVLKIVPPAKEGDEERLELAQVVMRKDPVPAAVSREQIAAGVRRQKEQGNLKARTDELAKKASISCPLFPTLYTK
jgi:parvulin-like peptidyl-prolyl isomerase